MKGELVKIKTRDDLTLFGFLTKPNSSSKTAIVNIHGTSGNFYWDDFFEPLENMASELGLAFLSTNNRGNGVYEVEAGTISHGASLEKFEDCLLDIDAWIEYCLDKGYQNIILEGHSFGTEKSVYYMAKGKYRDKVIAVILLGFSDNVGTQKRYENKIGKNYLDEARKLFSEKKNEQLLSDLKGLAGELPISAQTYLNFFSENSENSIALPLRNGKNLTNFQNIKTPILGVIGDKDDGEYTIIPIIDAINLLKSENKNADVYQIKDCNHSFEGKEEQLVKIVREFLEKRVLIRG
jgi:pimeloyl-ACP methyl ester carboxylesterase